MRLLHVRSYTLLIMLQLSEPTLIVDEKKVRSNIKHILSKLHDIHQFRPHFKTHQSHSIGRIFRELGIHKICVSSMRMAHYFHSDGWNDICIAFPFYPQWMDELHSLIQNCTVQIVIESEEVLHFLQRHLMSPVDFYIKIDAGYGRAGIKFQDEDRIKDLIKLSNDSDRTNFKGLLAHFGDTYAAERPENVIDIYQQSLQNLVSVQKLLTKENIDCSLSIGDTPSSSCLDRLDDNIEYRPGNFVYYDLMQTSKHRSNYDQIACVVACPIVAIHPEKNECIIHGGGVHFSKDHILDDKGNPYYGLLANKQKNGSWSGVVTNVYVDRLSQEHGIIKGDKAWISSRKIGEWVYVYPIHSCMTVHAMRRALNITGEPIDIMI